MLDSFGENRLFAFVHAVQQLPIQRFARDFGLEASPFATVAQPFVVEDSEVAELAAESRFAFVQLAVEYESAAQSPTEVDEDDVFLTFDYPFDHLAISHGSGIVVDAYGHTYSFGHNLGQGTLLEIELREAVSPTRD